MVSPPLSGRLAGLPFLLKPLPQLIRREGVLSDVFAVIVARSLVLDRTAPGGQIRIQFPGDLPVHVDVVEESAERTPRESAPDVVQRVACPYEQVFFDCLTVLAYEFREAADSPSFSFPSERP